MMLNCTMNILPRKEYIKALYGQMLARSELNKYYIVQRLLYYVGRMGRSYGPEQYVFFLIFNCNLNLTTALTQAPIFRKDVYFRDSFECSVTICMQM